MSRFFIITLVAVCVLLAQTRLTLAQQSTSNSSNTAAYAEKIKRKVEKIKLNSDLTAILIDNREIYGSLKSVEAEEFSLFEPTTKQIIKVRYDQVRKLEKGYSFRDPVTGKRTNARQTIYGILIGGAIIFGVALAILATDKS